MFFSPQEIAALIQEDQPFLDLTTRMLGIGDKAADMRFRCRQDISVAGTELAVKILDACGLMVTESQPSGALVATGTTLLAAEGSASAAHSAWKVAQNVLEYACGIATYSAQLVQQARQINPRIAVVATRKNIPGIRRFAVMAALAGGVMPHRLGISESVLVFDQHLAFLGGLSPFLQQFAQYRRRVPSSKIVVEVQKTDHTLTDALALAQAGVAGIQFDKMAPEPLAEIAAKLRAVAPEVTLFAAGGITLANIQAYAATGMDALVTSAVYHAAPTDIGVEMRPV
ncbi:ModD protein [Acidithiobacillus ferrooxidans]|jgi:molybdenum transport protein|uniref:ModD protein n=1 Tax=Acidithiobacillus ferrooxidans TaxID=920 RepID=UPI001C065365|nr:ModD protein [Acidithiobacillus ferrooxidans]MCL4525102.1 ModD protein [Gammaproteobacteria bacterium]MDA8153434.1 ModD protein [Acidithiobacillus sp.]MBU2857433.1 ModD protein [Acidithiobacillus ferrooxidans]MBU2859977.1 ModD protein [Acidithiobacillus ferrooxidans]MCL5957679.1 ModD protein [Gammaproteobacteria bacterium]